MNDLKFSLSVLEEIYKEAQRDDMTFAEKAGLYAGARTICSDFEAYIEEELGGDGYALEKIGKYEWHIAAALGFDIDNGHAKAQHIISAIGQFWTLRDVLIERVGLE